MNTSNAAQKIEETITAGPDETRQLAGRLLADLPDRRIYALYGELGSGKTCFVQGLAMALGIRRIVTSPTFTIVNEYRGPRTLYHIDLYRLEDAAAALDVGLEDYLESGELVAVEWANRIGSLLPGNTVHVRFSNLPDPHKRRISITWLPDRVAPRPRARRNENPAA